MIPFCLEKSDEYQGLTDRQRRAFEARLAHCVEIQETLRNLIDSSDLLLADSLDDVELDAFSVMSLRSPDESVSPYLVHSSWTQYCSPENMSNAISEHLKSFVNAPIPGSNGRKNWLRGWADQVSDAVHRFQCAETFDAAVANCIAIDLLMTMILQFAAMRRVNIR